MISHQSFTEIARKWVETAPIGVGDNWISITPIAWIVDQMWGVGVSPLTGMTMNFPETLETQAEDFRELAFFHHAVAFFFACLYLTPRRVPQAGIHRIAR